MEGTHKVRRGGIRRSRALLWRGLCVRCPRCGAQSLFRTWLAMHEQCAVCGLRFEREQGYFMGAMYINYGVTVVLALLGSSALEVWTQPSLTSQLVLWIGFGTVFPVLFFRHSRGVWLGFDYIFDPGAAAEPENRRGQDELTGDAGAGRVPYHPVGRREP